MYMYTCILVDKYMHTAPADPLPQAHVSMATSVVCIHINVCI